MENWKNLALLGIIQVLLIVDCARVSPKLNFEEASDVVGFRREIKTGKIKGVRVTVDTSELKGSPESKSSSSDSSSSSIDSIEKKIVGVRTDVTFEITSGETNDTKTIDDKEIGKDDDNASIPIVPVFKGALDRGINSTGSEDLISNDIILSVKPLEGPSTGGPIFHKTEDDRKHQYAERDDKILQYVIWTTERYNRRYEQPVYHHRGQYDFRQKPLNHIPHQIYHEHHPYQPCYCQEYPGPFMKPQDLTSPELYKNHKIDDKLEKPFSKT